MRTTALLFLALLVPALLTLSACATDPQDRGAWHQYLHDHGLE
jgi:hypothetical protein